MRTKIRLLSLIVSSLIICNNKVNAQASCSAAAPINVLTTCSTTSGNLQNAANEAPAGSCGGATATTTFGVWYKFTASSTNPTITVNNLGGGLSLTTTYVEVLSGSCGSFISLGCQNVSTRMSLSGLTVGTTYYVRVYTTTQGTGNPKNKWNFDLCIQDPPANDNCSGAITLTSNTSCTNTVGSLDLSTPTSGLPAGCESAGTHYDVWFKFNAAGNAEIITVSSPGANITSPEIQLYSGACGTLTSLACGTTSITATGLTIGNTYYVRVSNVGTNPSGSTGAGFSICVYHPTPAKVDYSRSYINVSKGATGGTVNPGDTLEMRATFVVSSKTVDSLSFTDTLYNTKGLAFVPGSIVLRTNEGKAYKSFTDGYDTDAGWYSLSGSDTVIHINFGTGASNYARGQLSNTSRPSVFNSTCIIMATYRVVVYAGYNTQINFKSGVLTYRDAAIGVINSLKFNQNYLMVYQSPGLCPNAVSATNALGAESNGTFGTPTGVTPLARNRGTSSNTSYVYTPFTASGGPQDYYYGIANNTSSKFTIVNSWLKPDANGYRVFNLWDISGDHTGATNLAKGNPACDTTQPISPTNPCGYMLVINSAYRADTAFTYNVTNLCPNTYYELSGWFKNICYKCGCDSTGAGTSSATYIPSGPGDSSGVQPNIAFDVNGNDYYTTGNIKYLGTTQAGSDSTNQWVKRGFVYLTGPTETSFRLTMRNNAPGGGGNDWALDDISVATCLPNMKYSPSLNPTTCKKNAVTINDTIQSYSNNYIYYKWQVSTDNGTSWSDISGATGTGAPAWNGSAWQYVTSYTLPPTSTDSANNGDKYRVVVATTSGNLAASNCQFTDGVSIISLNVITCASDPLKTNLLSFNGSMQNNHPSLSWTTSREDEPVVFELEKSTDQRDFKLVTSMPGANNTSLEKNLYTFTDSAVLHQRTFYRLAMVSKSGNREYSRTIQLNSGSDEVMVSNIQNPFSNKLDFELIINRDTRIEASLLNMAGNVVKQENLVLHNGVNNLSMHNLNFLSPGVYVLQLHFNGEIITRKIVKK